jgi:hypothetical protein
MRRMPHMSKAHSGREMELTHCIYSLISTRCRNFHRRDVAFQINRFAFRA